MSRRVDAHVVSPTGEHSGMGVATTDVDEGGAPYVVANPASLWFHSPLQQTVVVYSPMLGPGTVMGTRVWCGPPVTRTPGSVSPAQPGGTMSIALVAFYTEELGGVKWLAFRVYLFICVWCCLQEGSVLVGGTHRVEQTSSLCTVTFVFRLPVLRSIC